MSHGVASVPVTILSQYCHNTVAMLKGGGEKRREWDGEDDNIFIEQFLHPFSLCSIDIFIFNQSGMKPTRSDGCPEKEGDGSDLHFVLVQILPEAEVGVQIVVAAQRERS